MTRPAARTRHCRRALIHLHSFERASLYFCLGVHLARREISAVLRQRLTPVPVIRAVGEPDYLLSSSINDIKRLPGDLG